MNANAEKARREAMKTWDGSMAKCRTCYRTMPTYEFGRNRTKVNGLQEHCRSCRSNLRHRVWLPGVKTPKRQVLSRADAQAKAVKSFLWKMEGRTGTGCIDWPHTTVDRHGYGQVVIKDEAGYNHTFGAHRLAWIAEFGDIPDGYQVRHRCRRPLCVNVNHLDLGTHEDNKRDAEWHEYVTRRFNAGESPAALAREYSTLPSVIFAIVTGSTWATAVEAAA